jgi:squalene-hopene/tetraprenyl-beta-curcumene cyclase
MLRDAVNSSSGSRTAERLHRAWSACCEELLAQRNALGVWVGRLASSALSTATAVSALAAVRRAAESSGEAGSLRADDATLRRLIQQGLKYLAAQQNPDGGFGDTDRSLSNIATTMLVQAAVHLAGAAETYGSLLERAEDYVQRHGGLAGLRRRYGRDRTFAVPILANAALAGLVPWREVTPLPFELTCFPQWGYRFLRLPVVSYAIPALVAIGQARYVHRPPRNPLMRWLRAAAVRPSLRVAQRMQPASGGFLEATPLTSFVVMSLAGSGHVGHPIVEHGVRFLLASVRDDGSWPIDTNLATWNTTLALGALAAGGDEPLRRAATPECLDWLLQCQHRQWHPFTGARPGGWAWTDLSGGVPDADDTSGALLALAHWPIAEPAEAQRIAEAALQGIEWLLRLQNRDGGWPTFCRGWGKLPFDRSATDLTAHALRALAAWRAWLAADGAGQSQQTAVRHSDMPRGAPDHDAVGAGTPGAAGWALRNLSPAHCRALVARIDRATRRGWKFLLRTQRPDGSWVPLWFGNQYHPQEENPVYGTAKVLLACAALGRSGDDAARRGAGWLVAAQNDDGGWGSAGLAGTAPRSEAEAVPCEASGMQGSSVEETALAVEALAVHVLGAGGSRGGAPSGEAGVWGSTATGKKRAARARQSASDALQDGLSWLLQRVERGEHRQAAPIGFYFARLWYYEMLYPLTFTVGALGRALSGHRNA